MAFYSKQELLDLGLKKFGKNIYISKKCSMYNPQNILIGDNVRIDDFCVLSAGAGGIEIGSFIHIGVYTSLIGAGKIVLEDYCNLSSKVAIYSSNDDYSGNFMTNPMVSSEYTNVQNADVIICKHVIVGSGSVILPGSVLEIGSAIGSLSMVSGVVPEFQIYGGTPAKFLKKRNKNLIEIERKISK